MIADFLDRDEVARYVGAMRAQVGAGELPDDLVKAAAATIGGDASTPEAAAQSVLAALPSDNLGAPSSGGQHVSEPFMSRAPIVSLLQTSLEDEARANGLVHAPEHRGAFAHVVGVIESIKRFVEEHIDPVKFSTADPDWVTKIAASTLDRLAKGNHPFNPAPAEYEIASARFRVVVVGDWGSGLPRACQVATLMAGEVADARAHGTPVHVIHLGDVYYSGDPVEVQRRVLADGMWPVTKEDAAAGVTSWSLNGNHDMYGGGYGYFETLLGDQRFKNQRSADGKTTSFFRIHTPAWDLVGLDTSWDEEVLSAGQKGVLADPQATIVAEWAAEARAAGRQFMLLSHHQFVSVYDPGDLGDVLKTKLGSLLDRGLVSAWLWGHEHRCMSFTGVHGLPVARCIGHGGIPVQLSSANGTPPAPGGWIENGSFSENGCDWHRFGFAVLDFDGPEITVRYRDDEGTVTRRETLGVDGPVTA